MKHIVLSNKWSYGNRAVPAYRCAPNGTIGALEVPVVGLKPDPNLPDDAFRVMGRDDGELAIVPGRDETSRCLIFAGASDFGFFLRGARRVTIFHPATNGRILASASYQSKDERSVELAAILGPDESVAFRKHGAVPALDEIEILTWTHSGLKVETTNFKEWSADVDYQAWISNFQPI